MSKSAKERTRSVVRWPASQTSNASAAIIQNANGSATRRRRVSKNLANVGL